MLKTPAKVASLHKAGIQDLRENRNKKNNKRKTNDNSWPRSVPMTSYHQENSRLDIVRLIIETCIYRLLGTIYTKIVHSDVAGY